MAAIKVTAVQLVVLSYYQAIADKDEPKASAIARRMSWRTSVRVTLVGKGLLVVRMLAPGRPAYGITEAGRDFLKGKEAEPKP